MSNNPLLRGHDGSQTVGELAPDSRPGHLNDVINACQESLS